VTAKNKNICPKCKGSNWQVWATDALPNNAMKCKDCGYEGTFPVAGVKK